ncbi:hypothetical protein NMY22_g12768 [Coprinellus aureogranulatus]|nr:hypothetical protein NMY22_g12768 [Coprinellus aureogranulatus]
MSTFPEEPLNAGYFPGTPNQVLNNGTYTIVRKLGWGTRSSTWLVRQSPSATNSEVLYWAAQIFTTSSSKDAETNLLPVLKTPILSSGALSVPLTSAGVFTRRSPVLFDDAKNGGAKAGLPVHTVQRITSVVLEALQSLHSRHIMHGGVTLENVAFSPLTQAEFLQPVLDASPPPTDTITIDGLTVVRSQPLDHYKPTWNEPMSDVADWMLDLVGYGHAQVSEFKLEPDHDYASAPETLTSDPSCGLHTDIWMLGSLVFHLLTGRPLLSSPSTASSTDKLTEITNALQTLEKTLADALPNASDAQAAYAFLQKSLVVDPEGRASAKELKGDDTKARNSPLITRALPSSSPSANSEPRITQHPTLRPLRQRASWPDLHAWAFRQSRNQLLASSLFVLVRFSSCSFLPRLVSSRLFLETWTGTVLSESELVTERLEKGRRKGREGFGYIQDGFDYSYRTDWTTHTGRTHWTTGLRSDLRVYTRSCSPFLAPQLSDRIPLHSYIPRTDSRNIKLYLYLNFSARPRKRNAGMAPNQPIALPPSPPSSSLPLSSTSTSSSSTPNPNANPTENAQTGESTTTFTWLDTLNIALDPILYINTGILRRSRSSSDWDFKGNAKLALNLWSRKLQEELLPSESLPEGITVIAMNPGRVDTHSVRAPRAFRPLAHFLLTRYLGFVEPDVGTHTTLFAAASKQVLEERERYQAGWGAYLAEHPVPGSVKEPSVDNRDDRLKEELFETTETILKDLELSFAIALEM